MNKPGGSGLKRIVNAFFFSVSGFKLTFKNEEAFRQECFLLILMLPLSIYLAESGIEFALYFGSFLLILFAELINSAIESIVDRIGPEMHPLSGQAKDVGSAIVFLAITITVIIWGSLLFF